MKLQEAIELYEFNNISKIYEDNIEDQLKVKFRQLSRKYHPDNLSTGNPKKFIKLIEAKEEIEDAIKRLKNYQVQSGSQSKSSRIILLTLDNLVRIYNGEEMESNGGIKINRDTIKENNTLIFLEATVTINGQLYNFNNINPWSIKDNYDISCEVLVDSLNSNDKIKIEVGEKSLEIEMIQPVVNIKFHQKFNISVDITIRKKLK